MRLHRQSLCQYWRLSILAQPSIIRRWREWVNNIQLDHDSRANANFGRERGEKNSSPVASWTWQRPWKSIKQGKCLSLRSYASGQQQTSESRSERWRRWRHKQMLHKIRREVDRGAAHLIINYFVCRHTSLVQLSGTRHQTGRWENQ